MSNEILFCAVYVNDPELDDVIPPVDVLKDIDPAVELKAPVADRLTLVEFTVNVGAVTLAELVAVIALFTDLVVTFPVVDITVMFPVVDNDTVVPVTARLPVTVVDCSEAVPETVKDWPILAFFATPRPPDVTSDPVAVLVLSFALAIAKGVEMMVPVELTLTREFTLSEMASVGVEPVEP